MKRIYIESFLVGLLFMVFFAGCQMDDNRRTENKVPSNATIEGTITVFMPDGSVQKHDGWDITTGSNTERTYWTDMEGHDHNTTLPTMIDYNHK
jgi:hypothetical protein